MKKLLFLCTVALLMVACGQKDNKNQEDTKKEEKVFNPPMVPVAPMTQVPPSSTGVSLGSDLSSANSNGTVLKIEEGKPLDLSQLMGERKSLGDQAAERIDSIRYFAEQGKADYQYLYGACFENGWGVDEDDAQAFVWYKKAADQNQKASYNSLGNFYRMGKA